MRNLVPFRSSTQHSVHRQVGLAARKGSTLGSSQFRQSGVISSRRPALYGDATRRVPEPTGRCAGVLRNPLKGTMSQAVITRNVHNRTPCQMLCDYALPVFSIPSNLFFLHMTVETSYFAIIYFLLDCFKDISLVHHLTHIHLFSSPNMIES